MQTNKEISERLRHVEFHESDGFMMFCFEVEVLPMKSIRKIRENENKEEREDKRQYLRKKNIRLDSLFSFTCLNMRC